MAEQETVNLPDEGSSPLPPEELFGSRKIMFFLRFRNKPGQQYQSWAFIT